MFEKNENRQKEAGVGPFLKKYVGTPSDVAVQAKNDLTLLAIVAFYGHDTHLNEKLKRCKSGHFETG